ncbi:uncharacterized protein FMAN_09813 [Fusarium mangiferae]|uniref:WD-like domain-containing protein n=1 Tax=Fusarium mangiferae TaxID=192010 RepID=A0A1L7TP08_FUSMA|nr:uncharacterized protein FMAN_09813 [Fusarium mangiferae]CVL00324.1 uncharacterized protein FMAN_09813 [Fusarium mangiferae]
MLSQLLTITLMLTAQHAVAKTNSSHLPEQLFLDIPINDVLQNTSMLPLIEPWSSRYVEAIQSKRYGDAIWARFHMEGDVQDGITQDTNDTILDIIKEDAAGYKVNAPVQYAEAVAFYASTSSEDTHSELIKAIVEATPDENLAKRATFKINCDRANYLASQSDCQQLIRNMLKSKINIGDTRLAAIHGGCRLRVGPYRSAPDVTYNTAHAVAILIEEKCVRRIGCCQFVSGSSPKNGGHRKVCLSSKRSGCR